MVQANFRNQCQNKLVRVEDNAVFCSSKAAALIEKRLMASCPQRGGTFFQPIANREAIFWVLSSGKVVPDWQQELGIYSTINFNLQRWVQSEFSALPFICKGCCIYNMCMHPWRQARSTARLCVKAFCCLHMPALGVVVPSPWNDMKASRQIQQV